MADYRYTLRRTWPGGDGRRVVWIMLNPSTADDTNDDPTIRRCISFSARWGHSGLEVVNLYALRSTDPKGLWSADDPVGPENDRWIIEALSTAYVNGWPVVAAWGANARPDRADALRAIAERRRDRLRCLGVTQAGHPRHPLYVKGDTPLSPWPAQADR